MNDPHGIRGRGSRRRLPLLAAALALPVLAIPQGVTAAVLALTPEPTLLLLARGGGFGGGGRGGGFSGGGGRSARSGFGESGGAAGLNRGATRPTGGWSNRVPSGGASPGLNRPASLDGSGFNRAGAGGGSRDWGAAGQGGNRFGDSNRPGTSTWNGGNRVGDGNRPGTSTWSGGNRLGDGNRPGTSTWNSGNRFNNTIGANWNRSININNVNLSPGWARPGWGYARPWGFGWYGGWASPPWGWWGANAALWGLSTLASAAVINAAVDSAVASSTTYIIVPNTGYQLLFGTIQPVGSQGVSFMVQADGATYSLTADCNLGTINGVYPSSADQAQLLNAACQVAYGST